MPVASAPRGPVELPALVRERAPRAEAVWLNLVGGLTFRDETGGRFLKWNPLGTAVSLADERDRLAWVIRFLPVPEVFERGELLVTRAIPGEGAVAARWLAEPRTAVRAIGEGLRALHDALPVDECPFAWSTEDRLARLDPESRVAIGAAPPVERLVVCHGDACAPNTLVSAEGRWIGHVDLATLGVADRWADLAVATMSLGWNYGDGWEAEFFDAYGIDPDADRIAYYRDLWNAG